MSTKYIGLDVHQASTTIHIQNSKGKTVHETVMETDGFELRDFLAAISGKKEVALEEGCMSDWLFMLLNPVANRLVVCDPRANPWSRDRKKNDSLDAFRLANALRLNELKPVFHHTSPMLALRTHLRSYQQLTLDVTRNKNRLKAIFRGRGISSGDDLYSTDGRAAYLDQLDLPEYRQRAGLLFEQLDFLNDHHQKAYQTLVACARKHEGYRWIKSVPGLGPIRTATVLATVVTPHRFRTKRLFWSYCGLAVVFHTSGDWKRGPKGLERVTYQHSRGLNKNRNRFLKEVFKSGALDAIKSSPLKEFYHRHLDRGLPESLGRVVVARKLASVALTLWKKGELFDPRKI
jgi:transposase